jgi:uncharacterized protein YbjQ (UPF0145 family)
MRSKIYSILCILFLSSCSTAIKTDNTAEKYEATDSKRIEVYSTDKIGKEYVILGEVSSAAWAGEAQFRIMPISDKNADAAVRRLKNAAAKLGADAIINLRLSYEYGYKDFTDIMSNGTAVKFKN